MKIVNGRGPVRGIHSSEHRIPTHRCPVGDSVSIRRPTVSHTTVNAAGQADRLAHHKALLQEG